MCAADGRGGDPRRLGGGRRHRDRRGRRPRSLPRDGRAVPARELHAGAGRGPGRHPVRRRTSKLSARCPGPPRAPTGRLTPSRDLAGDGPACLRRCELLMARRRRRSTPTRRREPRSTCRPRPRASGVSRTPRSCPGAEPWRTIVHGIGIGEQVVGALLLLVILVLVLAQVAQRYVPGVASRGPARSLGWRWCGRRS